MRRDNRGFTLVELLAGIAIFALISGSLYGALGVAVRAFDNAGRHSQSEQRMRVVSGFVQRSLEQAYPLALVRRGGWRLLFEGDAESLRYAANLPGYLGFGGLYETRIRSSRENGRLRLLLDRRPLVLDRIRGELLGELETEVLLEDIESLKLRYFGTAKGEDSPGWHDRWGDSRRLPALVEARITLAGGEAWPLLVARPRVNSVRFQMAAGALPIGADNSAPRPRPAAGTAVLN